ncbi:MAG: hypothetical protein C0516_07860 [Gemmatimonas sp.]|nr:hypothetical protein [Gemmatimonas sp.]
MPKSVLFNANVAVKASQTDPLFLSLQQALAGRYSLDRELGRGGNGVVYLAREVRLDRQVAIKVLPPDLAADPQTRERFLREARTSARLAHPHIIPIYAVDVVEDHVFYAMGFVDGESLAQRVAVRGPLAPREGARLLREVAWALAHAHAQGVVHRDIKPDNILIEIDSGRAIVADFGIAAAVGARSDGVIGTPAFMSPEQVLGGELDARSDLYALGATAYFAFTARPPFEGSDLEVLSRHIAEPAPSMAAVGLPMPRYLVQVVAQCLAKARVDRPRDAHQVAELLGKVLAERRELPAVLRAFVKRDSRTNGMGTVGVLLAACVPMWATASALGIWSIAVGYVFIVMAAVVFVIRNALRLLGDGFKHVDVVSAFEAELVMLREERRLRPRPALARLQRVSAASLRIIAGASLTTALAIAIGPEGFVSDAVYALMGVLFVLALFAQLGWVAARLGQSEDTQFWRSLWSGRVGAWSFDIARRLRGAAPVSLSMTHRATELSLSLASESLFTSLPADVRRSLRDVPEVLQCLQEGASRLRDRGKRLDELLMSSMSGDDVADIVAEQEHVARQLEETVGALERMRLDLLRLHANVATIEGVTTSLRGATELHRHIQRHLEATREVEDVFETAQAGEVNAPLDEGCTERRRVD